MRAIDLRSDTVTRPSEGMLDAMMSADVDDDVFESDPSVNRLQEMAASFFGKEAALFCPSGTMTNQIAIQLQAAPMTEVITEESSHVYNYEVGGISFNARASVKLINGDTGRISAYQIDQAINPVDIHKARTSLVCLENSANRGGGACYHLGELERIHKLCRDRNLKLHLDGARLCNAAIATRTELKKYGPLFDTISICLSKGLGAPVGSLLLGNQKTIYEARRVRKVFGGGMRQAGFLAAAAQYALENNIERLRDDHDLAKKMAELLLECDYIESVIEPETNILIFGLKSKYKPEQFLNHLKENNILAVGIEGQAIRFVTHLDVSPNDLNHIEKILKSFSS
ncbi:MAG: threonine aldolase [Bacteriovoracaceae bacterium]|nr:threonine aldolase [Bacteriovoracaceae bacterium]